MDYQTEDHQPDLAQTLDVLKSEDSTLNSTIFYGLSMLEPAEVERLTPVWKALDDDYRSKLVRELVEASEANFELDYSALGYLALDDPDPNVREAAVELLWEDESMTLMNRLIDLVTDDEAAAVRAAAASALGRFILAGELGDLPETETVRAQDAVVGVLTNLAEDIDVRRRALEAIANCGHEIVEGAIEEAAESHDRRMQISAVFAMGRTYDDRWSDRVLRELGSEDAEMRYEAARAAGELEIEEAVPHLTRLALDDDREIQEVAIWSLGEIGTKEATRTLDRIATEAKRLGDDVLLEAVEDALAAASMGSGSLYLMDVDEEE